MDASFKMVKNHLLKLLQPGLERCTMEEACFVFSSITLVLAPFMSLSSCTDRCGSGFIHSLHWLHELHLKKLIEFTEFKCVRQFHMMEMSYMNAFFFVHPSWPDGVFSKLWINRYSRISPEIRIELRCSAITLLPLHDWTKRLLMMWTLYYRYSPVIAPVSANILARFHHGAGLR